MKNTRNNSRRLLAFLMALVMTCTSLNTINLAMAQDAPISTETISEQADAVEAKEDMSEPEAESDLPGVPEEVEAVTEASETESASEVESPSEIAEKATEPTSAEEDSAPVMVPRAAKPKKQAEITTVADALKSKGKTVTVEGTVITPEGIWGKGGFYLQDDTGSIFVFSNKTYALNIGDKVQVKAKVGEHSKAIQLNTPSSVKKQGQGTGYDLKVITIGEAADARLNSVVKLEKVKVVTITEENQYGTASLQLEDGAGNKFPSYVDNRSGWNYKSLGEEIGLNGTVDITGILCTHNGNLQIKPFRKADITVIQKGDPNAVQPAEALKVGQVQGADHRSPYEGKTVEVKDVVVTQVADAKGFYVQDITPDDDPKTSDGIYVYYTGKEKVTEGSKLEIKGKVEEYVGPGYDDAEKTHLTTTQLKASTVKNVGTAEVPEPVVIKGDTIPSDHIENDGLTAFEPNDDSLDFWESKEGMQVALDDAKIVGPQSYGNISVLPADTTEKLNGMGGYTLKENQNPNIITICTARFFKSNGSWRSKSPNLDTRAGDQIRGRVQGAVSYNYGGYKIDTLTFKEGMQYADSKLKQDQIIRGTTEPEKTTITFDADKLTIAEYNVENFSTKTKKEKVDRIAKSMVEDLGQPDIITIIEMMDNSGDSDDGVTAADKSAGKLIDAIIAHGGKPYTYADIEPEDNANGGKPGGNIRVGFLYLKDRVSLEKIEAIGVQDSLFQSTRKPLAGFFKFNDEKVLVVGNHWNSKRGDDSLFGKNQPVNFGSEAKRHKIAKYVYDYIDEVTKKDPKLVVVANGDLNDFEFTKSISILEGELLTDLVKNHPFEDRFSYFYNGNSQTLDHTLVSNSIVDKCTFDMVHINALFMEKHGRASDHDPQIVQIDFSKQTPEPEAPKLLQGEGQTWKKGAQDGLTFISSAEFNTLKEVKVDHHVLESGKDYIAVAGSTKVTLSPAYLETLDDGSHAVEIVSEAGAVGTEFKVEAAESSESSSEQSQESSDNPQSSEQKPEESSNKPQSSEQKPGASSSKPETKQASTTKIVKQAPKTGDAVLVMPVATLVLSAGALIALKKKKSA